MVKYQKSLDYSQPNEIKVKINASQTIIAGDLIFISSGKGSKATAASTAIIGIALEAITTGAEVTDADEISVLMINSKSVIRLDYAGVTKTSLTSADMWITAFDITSAQKVNLDDTTGGQCLVVGYDNTNETVDVIIKASALFNA
jgi:hypothetical protein